MEQKALPLLEAKDIATKVVTVDGHTTRVEVLECLRSSVHRHRRTVHVGLAAAGFESPRERRWRDFLYGQQIKGERGGGWRGFENGGSFVFS